MVLYLYFVVRYLIDFVIGRVMEGVIFVLGVVCVVCVVIVCCYVLVFGICCGEEIGCFVGICWFGL